MIYGVCGRQSRKTLLKIHENMEILRSAGNRPTNHGNDKGIQEIFIYEIRLQSLLDTVLARKVNEIICCVANNDDEQGSMSPQPSFDRQYATWVAAGLVVLMILLFAAPLSLLCIVLSVPSIGSNGDTNIVAAQEANLVGGSSLNCYQM